MSDGKTPTLSEQTRVESTSNNLPLVFISHDTRDAKLAEAFSKLLGSVSCGVLKSFRSSDKKGKQGIAYGVEWYPEIITRLDQSSDVVCLLTQNSINRPWILYEAGIAKGKRETPVYGVALGIPLGDAGTGPFAQFQNCGDDDDSLTSLVIQLLRRVPNAEPDRELVLSQVLVFKESIKSITKAIKTEENIPIGPVYESSTAKLFEEVKVMFKDLPSRVENNIAKSFGTPRERRRKRFHPMMFEKIMFNSIEENDPTGLLFIAGIIRDDLPWLYELTIEAYRTIRSGTETEIMSLMKAIDKLDMFFMKGPFMDDLIDTPEMNILVHDFPRMLSRQLKRTLYTKKSKTNLSKREAT